MTEKNYNKAKNIKNRIEILNNREHKISSHIENFINGINEMYITYTTKDELYNGKSVELNKKEIEKVIKVLRESQIALMKEIEELQKEFEEL